MKTILVSDGDKLIRVRYRVKYAELGIEFPLYDRDGMVMRFDQNGTLLRTLSIIGSRKEERRGFIES